MPRKRNKVNKEVKYELPESTLQQLDNRLDQRCESILQDQTVKYYLGNVTFLVESVYR